ncbi:hypothetical protein E2C01_074028 [Portunus trituberculatus]|uniref:Uncharacterized protein n=1 Tax=Portunus trituberculatus TaxID=210409 RepID=A0A5B7IF89_PORTR|nr:hypothetical protein [Portunus trituberculatus]
MWWDLNLLVDVYPIPRSPLIHYATASSTCVADKSTSSTQSSMSTHLQPGEPRAQCHMTKCPQVQHCRVVITLLEPCMAWCHTADPSSSPKRENLYGTHHGYADTPRRDGTACI